MRVGFRRDKTYKVVRNIFTTNRELMPIGTIIEPGEFPLARMRRWYSTRRIAAVGEADINMRRGPAAVDVQKEIKKDTVLVTRKGPWFEILMPDGDVKKTNKKADYKEIVSGYIVEEVK